MTVAITYPVDALISYHYYRSERVVQALVDTGRLRMIGDSGAYSAFSRGAGIGLAEYAAWCKRWRDHLLWVASLDVIGDPEGTFRNWLALRDTYGVDSVPTVHAGASLDHLDRYVAQGVDMVGLGGMVGGAHAAFPWLVSVFRHTRDHYPHVRYHGWGVTHPKLLEALPFYSADSSGALGAGYRYATMHVFDPGRGKHHTLKLDGRGPYRLSSLLRRTYGVDPAEIERSVPANRHLIIQLAAASVQQRSLWLQRRHRVPAPSWGLREPAGLGTHVHVVSAGAGGITDDLVTAAGLGTRIHATGGADKDLVALAGTRIHITDANPRRRDDAVGNPGKGAGL